MSPWSLWYLCNVPIRKRTSLLWYPYDHNKNKKWGLNQDDVTPWEFLKDKETFDDIFKDALKHKIVVAVKKKRKDLSQELELNLKCLQEAKTLQAT